MAPRPKNGTDAAQPTTPLSVDRINAYLHFGYLPNPRVELPFPADWVPREASRDRFRTLVKNGSPILRKAIVRSGAADRLNVVPISGGLDSRAILAALREEGFKLAAVTFGTPGTFDFELERRVARRLAVRHETIDLTAVRLSTEALVGEARRRGRWGASLEGHFDTLIAEQFGKTAVYQSGFMGGELGGSHIDFGSRTDWAQALVDFVRVHRRSRSALLTEDGFDPRTCLPMRATVPGLTCYEELDFGIRQTRLIRPAVLQPGYDYRTPYLDEQWVRFIMGAPPEFRQGKKLYRAILAETWPRAFHIPSKGDYGAPITSPGWYRSLARRRLQWGKRLQRKLASERRRSLCWGTLARLATPPWRMLNYIDLAQGMRDRPDVREVVETNVFDLARRGVVPWLDIEKIWAAHQSGARNHADALTVLAQLEVNLKAEEREG